MNTRPVRERQQGRRRRFAEGSAVVQVQRIDLGGIIRGGGKSPGRNPALVGRNPPGAIVGHLRPIVVQRVVNLRVAQLTVPSVGASQAATSHGPASSHSAFAVPAATTIASDPKSTDALATMTRPLPDSFFPLFHASTARWRVSRQSATAVIRPSHHVIPVGPAPGALRFRRCRGPRAESRRWQVSASRSLAFDVPRLLAIITHYPLILFSTPAAHPTSKEALVRATPRHAARRPGYRRRVHPPRLNTRAAGRAGRPLLSSSARPARFAPPTPQSPTSPSPSTPPPPPSPRPLSTPGPMRSTINPPVTTPTRPPLLAQRLRRHHRRTAPARPRDT